MREKAAARHPVDVHVGARMRLRRKLLGLSQMDLAEALGITFQQVQKYEAGANRISASRLLALSAILETPLGWFFEGLDRPHPQAPADEEAVRNLLMAPGGFELAQAFARTPGQLRRPLLDLLRAMAADETPDELD